jgi:hypothetical protein
VVALPGAYPYGYQMWTVTPMLVLKITLLSPTIVLLELLLPVFEM